MVLTCQNLKTWCLATLIAKYPPSQTLPTMNCDHPVSIFKGRHFNLIFPTADLHGALGANRDPAYVKFQDAFAGNVRQDAMYGNPYQGALHSKEETKLGQQFYSFHLDAFNPLADLIGLVGHFFYDVVGKHLGTCLDPAWRH